MPIIQRQETLYSVCCSSWGRPRCGSIYKYSNRRPVRGKQLLSQANINSGKLKSNMAENRINISGRKRNSSCESYCGIKGKNIFSFVNGVSRLCICQRGRAPQNKYCIFSWEIFRARVLEMLRSWVQISQHNPTSLLIFDKPSKSLFLSQFLYSFSVHLHFLKCIPLVMVFKPSAHNQEYPFFFNWRLLNVER